MTFLTPALPYRNPPLHPVHSPVQLYNVQPQPIAAGPSRVHPPPLPTRSSDMPPPSTIPARRKRKSGGADHEFEPATLQAVASSPSEADADEEDEDADDYLPTSAGPSRRPKKPTPSAKGGGKGAAGLTAGGRPLSREQLRKANHSLIERRRREKINFALSELREMVPGLGDTGKGGEFKLEVLERTVLHMRELKARIVELESAMQSSSSSSNDAGAGRKKARQYVPKADKDDHDAAVMPVLEVVKQAQPTRKSTTTPPSPSPSPEQSYSAPLSRHTSADAPLIGSGSGSRNGTNSPQQPSIASLLSQAHPSQRSSPAAQPPRPPAPPQAANPTLYLPFPTPSPTSPFLMYPGSSNTSTTATSATGPPEPSPFLAPLQHFSLFGGAIALDTPTSPEVKKSHSPSDHEGTAKAASGEQKKGDMRAEEAANLLLAFSSPDVMRPTGGLGLGVTTTSNGVSGKDEKQRRMTLDNEDFMLDGGTAKVTKGYEAFIGQAEGMVGKTARDILRMSD